MPSSDAAHRIAFVADIDQHSVVACHNRIGHAFRFQHLHGLVRHFPLLRLAGLVDDIAQVDDESNLEGFGIVGQSLSLGQEGRAAVAFGKLTVGFFGGVARIELRIWQDGQAEAGNGGDRRRRRRWRRLRRGRICRCPWPVRAENPCRLSINCGDAHPVCCAFQQPKPSPVDNKRK
ncbi:hypothetical protein [Massilia sp. PWRC2]|uniref:hypothetical protein n=1 Tax=Massilia sp. PWRC2 TaxID=2804626 RepID=UPI003CF20332